MSAIQNAPTQPVPAWKRLGLKLKGAASDGSPATTTPSPAAPPASANAASRFAHQQQQPNFNAAGYGTPGGFNKRKQFPSGSYPASDNKRFRRDEQEFTPSRKVVSFSGDIKKAAPKKPKKQKVPKPAPVKEPFSLVPALEYLKTWHTARDSWKFNKNHQTLLLKNLYTSNVIPSSDIDTFYLYIRDVKGGGRERLRQQAEEIKKKDMEDGSKGFPAGTKDVVGKQKQYEEMLADLLKQKAEIKDGATSNSSKRTFDEVEFVLRTVDKDVQQRVVKRMRAETVLGELEASDSEESTSSAPSTATAASTAIKVPADESADKRVKLNDGTQQKVKRRKKLRTADVDSSDSESDSDSDSSDSSDSDEDEEMGAGAAQEDAESSSSSSSSSSEDDTDVEAESQSESENEAQPANGAAAEEESSDESESSDDE